jgi:putative ABC transport system permease protein
MIVNMFGRLLPVTIRDYVDFFPTMRHSRAGFVLVDLDDLLRHINIVSPSSTIRPNEILITEAPGAGESVRDVVISLVGSPDLVHDRRADLEQIRLDPLIGAGWRAMVLVSIAIIVLTAGLGYVTYLLAFADRSRAEMGFLQSLGLSKRQLTGLLSLEHMVIIIIGLALGTLAGIQMSDLLVSSVAVTEDGRQVVPPFILQTDWVFMGIIYLILIGIFAASIYRLNRSMIHLNFHSVSRVEE